jgi:hypothetical protein
MAFILAKFNVESLFLLVSPLKEIVKTMKCAEIKNRLITRCAVRSTINEIPVDSLATSLSFI